MRLFSVILTLSIAHRVNSANVFKSILSKPSTIVNGSSDLLNGLYGSKTKDPCAGDVLQDYEKAMKDFSRKLYTQVAVRNDNHFVFSPYTIWLSLSALAEGADPSNSVQSQLFTSLELPQQKCARKKFYDIALNVETPGRDVYLTRQRSLILDEGLKMNPAWSQMMRSYGLLNVAYAPIKRNPSVITKRLRKFMRTPSNIVLKGNSVLLDSLDYKGLWTTEFSGASIKRQPFFDDLGQQIGEVEMMHMKKKVRLAHIPFMSAKVVELPVGINGRYTMLIAVGTGDNTIKNCIAIFMGSIMEIFSLLQESLFPMHVAVPRFAVNSEFDLKPTLDDIGIHAFWIDPAATRYVSDPPATPSGLIQRVSVKVDRHGVNSDRDSFSELFNVALNTTTNIVTALGHQFTADRPFMYALFDTNTHTCLFTGVFSKPKENLIDRVI